MNIFEKMSAITVELKTVAKNLEVSAGKNSYKAVSERDVLDAVKPLEAKYKVYSYPYDREIIESQILETESSYNGNTTKKSTFFTRFKTTYRFVNVEKPEEYIDMVTYAEGIDPGDKGSGKAMTYSDKYALMKAYKISTGDDPDKDPSPDNHYTQGKPGATSQGKAKSPREQLIALLRERGIDVNAYAKAHNLSGKTDEATFLGLIKELRG